VNPIAVMDGGYLEGSAVIGQEYKSMPENPVQKAVHRAENLAYGDERTKDQIPFGGLTVFGNQADKVRQDFLPRAGTPMSFDRDSVAAKQISITELMQRLIATGGPLSPETNRYLRETYGSSIMSSEADRLIDEYTATGCIDTTAPRQVEAQAC
jgi:hypothetical protein